jgi:hypothetical protein
MKQLIIFLSLILCLSCGNSYAQQLTGCPMLYHSSKEVFNTSCDTALKNVNRSVFGGNVHVRYVHGKTKAIPAASVWGYRNKGENLTRIWNDYSYELIKTSPVFVYASYAGRVTSYWYSYSLDSPIYPFKHMKKADPDMYAKVSKDDFIKRRL